MSIDDSVVAFLAAVGRFDPTALLVILRACVDESGTHAGADHLMMAGHVSSVSKWKRFETEWKGALKDAEAGSVHAKDLRTAQGQFRDWKRAKLKAFGDALLKSATRLGGFGLTLRMDYADFEEAYKSGKQPRKGGLDSAYGLCFRYWLYMIARLAGDLYAKHPGRPHKMIVLLEDSQRGSAAAHVHSEMKAHDGLGVMLDTFILGGKDQAGLQLADLIAHNTWRREAQTPPFTPVRYPLTLTELHAQKKEPTAIYRHHLDREFLAAYKSDIIENDAKRFNFGVGSKSG